jgi:hypothetical protein
MKLKAMMKLIAVFGVFENELPTVMAETTFEV